MPEARISIHALLAESDDTRELYDDAGAYFYPRSPCGERRWTSIGRPKRLYFYPRSPCGERLLTSVVNSTGTMDFYPRSPCGERPS